MVKGHILLSIIGVIVVQQYYGEAYWEPCYTSKMELFSEIVNGFQPLTISTKSSVLDVWQGSEYVSGNIQRKMKNTFLWKWGLIKVTLLFLVRYTKLNAFHELLLGTLGYQKCQSYRV